MHDTRDFMTTISVYVPGEPVAVNTYEKCARVHAGSREPRQLCAGGRKEHYHDFAVLYRAQAGKISAREVRSKIYLALSQISHEAEP